MFVPYWVVLLPFVLAVVIYIFLMGLNVYHLMKFGFFDFAGKLNLFTFSLLSVVVIGFAALFLSNVEWTNEFDLLQLPSLLLPLPESDVPDFL